MDLSQLLTGRRPMPLDPLAAMQQGPVPIMDPRMAIALPGFGLPEPPPVPPPAVADFLKMLQTGITKAMQPGQTPFANMLDPNASNASRFSGQMLDTITQAPQNLGGAFASVAKPAIAAVVDQFREQDQRAAATTIGATPAPSTVPQAPAVFKWPQASQASGKTSMTLGTPAGGGDTLQQSMQLIRSKEGFIDTAKYDVNHERVGYGSDTITDAEGKVRAVQKGDRITLADAERDLVRRTGEYIGTVKSTVGDEAFGKLTPNQVAALTSVAYNYGKLPAKVVAAVKTGDSAAIASAVEALGTDNDGVNAKRRADEAAIIRGTGNVMPQMPGVPNLTSAQIPIPSAIKAQQGINPQVFDEFAKAKPTATEPMTTGDRITNVLAHMAAGAQGGRNWADVLLGAGGGAAKGAAGNIATERGEKKSDAEKLREFQQMLAGVGVRKEGARVEGENFKTQAENLSSQQLYERNVQQANIDNETKNKLEGLKNQVDWKKFELFQPQITASKDGVTLVQKNPDGTIKIETTKTNEMDAAADRIKDAGQIFGKDSAVVSALQYEQLGKMGEPYVRRQMLRDMVEGNHAKDILGSQYEELKKKAEAGIPVTLMGKPEEHKKQFDARMVDLLWQLQLPDQAWIPLMAQRGNYGAKRMIQGGAGG